MSDKNTIDTRAAKKAAILDNGRKGHRTGLMILGGVVVFLLVAGGLLITRSVARTPLTETAAAPASASMETVVFHPASLFEDGKARHFSHVDGKITIRYFVIKSSDGVIRAAFDACDVCWRAGKGYVQDGDDMVCLNCSRRFASVMINEVKGGCNPAPLKRTLNRDRVEIQIDDLRQGKSYFDFSGKA